MADITLTQAENGQTREAHVGTRIAVTLPENPTTGYRWEIDRIDPAVLSEQDSSYSQTGNGAGAGGTRTFTFQAAAAGTSPLRLKLVRSWEGDASAAERYHVTVKVQ